MMALTLTMLFGVVGFSVDLGQEYYRKQAAKATADAVALAAAAWASTNTPACGTTVLCSSNTCSHLTTAGSANYVGCKYSTPNGFTDGSGTQIVTLSANSGSPSTTAPGVNAAYWFTATVTETEPLLFLGVLGLTSAVVRAESTAGLVSSGGGSNSCIYVLSPSASDAFQAGNNAHVSTVSCGVYVNSNNASSAMYVTGGATITSPIIDVVGGVTKNNGGTTSTTPVTGVSAVADPFASLGVPSAPANNPSCGATNASCNYSGNYSSWVSGGYTLSPGTYPNGISLSNGNPAVLAGGTYVLDGPFNIQSGPLTASGPVLIYLSGSAAYVSIANGTTVTLSALASGPFEGVLFYQDRTVLSPTASSFAGGANQNLSGSLYFPNAGLTINNGTNSTTGAVVASTVNFQGGATFNAGTQAQTGIATGTTYTPYVLQ
jgi:hypothetical protein